MVQLREPSSPDIPDFGKTFWSRFGGGLSVAFTTMSFACKKRGERSVCSLLIPDVIISAVLMFVLQLATAGGIFYGLFRGFKMDLTHPFVTNSTLVSPMSYTVPLYVFTVGLAEFLGVLTFPFFFYRIIHTLNAPNLSNTCSRVEKLLVSDCGDYDMKGIFCSDCSGLNYLPLLILDLVLGSIPLAFAYIGFSIGAVLFSAMPLFGPFGLFLLCFLIASLALGGSAMRVPLARQQTFGSFGIATAYTTQNLPAVWGYGCGMMFQLMIPIFGALWVPVGSVVGAERLRLYLEHHKEGTFGRASVVVAAPQAVESRHEGMVSESGVILERQGWERKESGMRDQITSLQSQLDNLRKTKQQESSELQRELSEARRNLMTAQDETSMLKRQMDAQGAAPQPASPPVVSPMPFATQAPLDDIFGLQQRRPSPPQSRRRAPAQRQRRAPDPMDDVEDYNAEEEQEEEDDDMFQQMEEHREEDLFMGMEQQMDDFFGEEEQQMQMEEEEQQIDDDDPFLALANARSVPQVRVQQAHQVEVLNFGEDADEDFADDEEAFGGEDFRDPTRQEIEANAQNIVNDVVMSQTGGCILLSNYEFAQNRVMLQRRGVNSIVQVCLGENPFKKQFQYHTVAVGEFSAGRLCEYLPDAVAFIDAALDKMQTVLVHCMHGASRGASVIAAYLMKKYSWGPKKSIAYLRRRRPQVKPKPMFMKQLRRWNAIIKGKAAPKRRRGAARRAQVSNVASQAISATVLPYFVAYQDPSSGNRLICSDYGFAQNSVSMKDQGIRSIIQVCAGHSPYEGDFDYLVVDASQRDADRVGEFLKETNMYIQDQIEVGNVLVHDVHGTSRCAVVAAAYLMKVRRMTPKLAINTLKRANPAVQPADCFTEVLDNFYAYLRRRPVKKKVARGTAGFQPSDFAPPSAEQVLENQQIDKNVVYVDPATRHRLYLSNYRWAQDQVALQRHRIRAVVQACIGTPPYEELFTYLRVEVGDLSLADITSHFERTSEFIRNHLARGNVLVHCQQGMSRGATLIAAFLMEKHEWEVDLAIRYIRHRRPMVQPNDGFMDQLGRYEKKLRGDDVFI